jgi:hypothetical protein
MAHSERHAMKVDVDQLLPNNPIDLGEVSRRLTDARIVDQYVYSAVVIDGSGNGGRNVGFDRHITMDMDCLPACGDHRFHNPLPFRFSCAIGNDDTRSFPSECKGDGTADAGRRPDDQGAAACKSH